MINKNSPKPLPWKRRHVRPAVAWLLCLSFSCGVVGADTRPTSTKPQSNANSGVSQDGAEVQSLELGKSVQRELTGGQSHSYQITFVAGQYAHMAVEQKGIDVVLKLLGPDGKALADLDRSNGTIGNESIEWIAETAGVYRLDVSAAGKVASDGRYEVILDVLRNPTPQDEERTAALKLFMEARQLRSQGKKESLEAGIKKFNDARLLYQKVEDRGGEAAALVYIGGIYSTLGDTQKALEQYNQALALRRASGDRGGEALALNNIGRAHEILGDSRRALEVYNQALPLLRAVGDTGTEATVLNNMGLALETLGELQKALDHYNQSLPLFRARGNRRGEAIAYINMGAAYVTLGELQKGLEHYHQGRAVLVKAGDKRMEAVTLNNLGNVYRSFGEMQKALEHLQIAVAIIREVGDRQSEAGITNNIGTVYQMLGELEKALEYRNEALQLYRATKNGYEEADTLRSIGTVYSDMGDMQKALEFYDKALPLLQAANDKRQVAVALNNIGTAYRQLSQPQRALDYYSQSLTLRRTVGDKLGEAATLNELGYLYATLGQLQKSSESYSQALSLAQSVGDRQTEAAILKNSALLKRDQGQLADSLSDIQRAIGLLEFIRVRAGGQDNRVSFSAAVSEYHELYIDLLMRMHTADPRAGHDLTALAVSEQSRARSLLELLAEARADIREGVDTKLLDRELRLKQRVTTSLDNLTKLLKGKHTDQQKAAAERAISELTDEYRQVQAEIRENSPRYAALTQPQSLATKELQQLLDSNTILLEYALGRDQSYLWMVTTDKVQSYQLPSRAAIEESARQVYQLLTARQPAIGSLPAPQRVRGTEFDAQYQTQAEELSRMILGPVAAELGTKRLLIVADGALQYLPFAALPSPKEEGGRPKDERRKRRSLHSPSFIAQPLIIKHEVVSLPSASVLAGLRREFAGRQRASKEVAVLADPVFSAEDARVKLSIAAGKSSPTTEQQTSAKTVLATATSSPFERAVKGVRGGDQVTLQRLLFSRDEAEAITTVTPALSTLKALDFQANRKLVMSDELRQYRVIHFATHGLLDSKHPELSGLVLSLVDEFGKPQDGFLRLHEIYNLRLNAELVVLSACQTALGREVKREGLIGLTRGFMYAGSPRVMASLWQVDDAATAQIMKRFYRGISEQKLPPAAALRAAQMEMLKKKHWQSPYYWAAFVLQGEWK